MSKITKWTYEQKVEMIEAHIKGGLSYNDVCKKFGLKSPGLFSTWVKKYKDGDLKPKPKGRKAHTADDFEIWKKGMALLDEIRRQKNR